MKGSKSKITRNERMARTKRVAVCGMLIALSVVILYIGSLVEVLDISMAAIASLICILAVLEYGNAYPWLVFIATSLISILILPQKSAGVIYAVFLGYYPMVKRLVEMLFRKNPKPFHKWLRWIIKIAIFNAAFLCFALIAIYVLIIPDFQEWLGILMFILANITFVVYDIALTRIISLYIYKIRKRFRLPGGKD